MAEDQTRVRLELAEPLDAEPQIRRLKGREAVSGLFELELEVVFPGLGAAELSGDLDRLLGARATLVWERGGEELRRHHGILREVAARASSAADHHLVHMRFVPRAWTLGLVEKTEIFMDCSIPAIVAQVLDLHGLSAGADVDMRLRDAYPTREFVVQYEETDLAFVSRLTEQAGISFFVSHDDGIDKLVVTDHPSGFERIPGETIAWSGRGELRGLHQLDLVRRMIPAVYAVRDYNYRTPLIDLQESVESEAGFAGGVVEFGPHVKTLEEAKHLARVRAEEREATARVYTGASDVCAIGAGRIVRVEGDSAPVDAELLITEVEHEITQAALAVGEADAERRYQNRFHAVRADRTFRPARRTPVPRVSGLLTGIVEGKEGTSGDFASIDGEGRYTIRFLYDTTAPGERLASRPVRMAQAHAGAGYGTHFPLKPGTEVVLAFVNGDPDRPIVVGAVPNPVTPTPVRDANLTSNVIKTASGIFFDFNDGPRGR